MARPKKVLSAKEIEALIDKKIRAVLGSLRVEGTVHVPGKRGRPVGWRKKKKS